MKLLGVEKSLARGAAEVTSEQTAVCFFLAGLTRTGDLSQPSVLISFGFVLSGVNCDVTRQCQDILKLGSSRRSTLLMGTFSCLEKCISQQVLSAA